MTGALLLALGLVTAAGPAPIGGCAAAQAALHDAPEAVADYELSGLVARPLAKDLGRLPSLQVALERVESAGSPDDRALARRGLASTLDVLCARPRVVPSNELAVDRPALDQILAQDQFSRRAVGGARLGTVLERLWDVIKEALYTAGWSSFSAFSRTAFLLLVLLAAVWLAFQVLRRPPARAPEMPTLDGKAVAEATEADLRRDAQAARARGELHRAIALEMAAVRQALSAGVSPTTLHARTDREWIAELSKSLPSMPQLPQLVQLAAQYERLFYGGASLRHEDVEAFQREAEALRQGRGALPR